VASFTDWLFMGVLFRQKYLDAPEVWRGSLSEPRKIIWSELIALITCAAFAYLLMATGRQGLASGLETVVLVWLAGAVPIVGINVVWMKLSPYIGVSHALGWLVRFGLVALAAAWLP
jgi:hypothetical protein